MLDNVALKDLLAKTLTPAAKREAVAHLLATYEISERRACRLMKADRKTVRYRSRRPRDEVLRNRLRELADEQVGSAVGALAAPVRVRNVLVCGSPGVHHLTLHWPNVVAVAGSELPSGRGARRKKRIFRIRLWRVKNSIW